jgi:hypothetical protein
MKKLYTSWLALLVMQGATGFLHAQVNFNANDLNTIARDEQKAHEWEFSFLSTGTSSNYDVKWYRCW